MSLIDYEMYIDGSFVNSENNHRFESLNPEDNKPWDPFKPLLEPYSCKQLLGNKHPGPPLICSLKTG